jgi:hypothetical protein
MRRNGLVVGERLWGELNLPESAEGPLCVIIPSISSAAHEEPTAQLVHCGRVASDLIQTALSHETFGRVPRLRQGGINCREIILIARLCPCAILAEPEDILDSSVYGRHPLSEILGNLL